MNKEKESKCNQNCTGKVAIVISALSIVIAAIAFIVANKNVDFPSAEFSYDKVGEFVGMIFSVIGVFFSIYFIVIGVSVYKFQRDILSDQKEVSKSLEMFTKKQKELDQMQLVFEGKQENLIRISNKIIEETGLLEKHLKESEDLNECSKTMLRQNAHDLFDFYSSLLGIMRGIGGSDKINEIELQKARFVLVAEELLKDDNGKLYAAVSRLGDFSSSYEDIDLLKRFAANKPCFKEQVNGIINIIESRICKTDSVIVWDEGPAAE